MSDELIIRNTPPAQDGIGMTIAGVRDLLKQEHGMKLDDNDPLLLLVTINNAFLAEYDKLLARHNDAMTACLGAEVEKYLADVRASADKLSGELSSASVQAHGGTLRSFQSNMIWLAVIVFLSAVINVVALLLRAKGIV